MKGPFPEGILQEVAVKPNAAPDPFLSSDPDSRVCLCLLKEMAVGISSVNHICSSGNMGQILTRLLNLWIRQLQPNLLNDLLMVTPAARPGPSLSLVTHILANTGMLIHTHTHTHIHIKFYLPHLGDEQFEGKGNLACLLPSP